MIDRPTPTRIAMRDPWTDAMMIPEKYSRNYASDAEKDEAIALARRDYVAGKLTLEQFEAEVEYALAGDLDRCGYLSPFGEPGRVTLY